MTRVLQDLAFSEYLLIIVITVIMCVASGTCAAKL